MTEHQMAIEKILLPLPFGFRRASFTNEKFLFRLIILLLIKESGNLNARIRSYTAIVHHLQPFISLFQNPYSPLWYHYFLSALPGRPIPHKSFCLSLFSLVMRSSSGD